MQKENQTLFHLNTKSVDFVRTFVDVVWPRSRVEPQKAREKWSLAYVQVSKPGFSLQSNRKPVPSQRSTKKKKKPPTSVSSRLEPATWLRATGQRIPCFHRCQLIKRWMSNIKDVLAWYWSHWHTWTGRRTDWSCWREFMAVFLRRMGSTASWEYPTLRSIYRGSKPVPLKLTGMAVNLLKDHTGGKKTFN